MLVLSACAKAVCPVYVRISLPTIVQLAPRPRTTGLCCVSSIWAELADVARLAALKVFVQWAHGMGVVSGSRTRKGTRPADRGASGAATPAASAATQPPASSVEPPVYGAVVPQAAAGVPSPATASPSHVCAAEANGAIGTPPPTETAAGVVGGVGWPWWCSPDRTVAWGGDDPVGEFREPTVSPHRLQLLKLRVGRTDSSRTDGAMKRATRTGCLSLRSSTFPTLRSDTTLHCSLRAGCRATFSRPIRRSRARNTSRDLST